MTALGRFIFLLSFFLAWPGDMNVFLAHLDGTHQMLLSEVIFFSHKNLAAETNVVFFSSCLKELWECILLQLL